MVLVNNRINKEQKQINTADLICMSLSREVL